MAKFEVVQHDATFIKIFIWLLHGVQYDIHLAFHIGMIAWYPVSMYTKDWSSILIPYVGFIGQKFPIHTMYLYNAVR